MMLAILLVIGAGLFIWGNQGKQEGGTVPVKADTLESGQVGGCGPCPIVIPSKKQ